MRRQVRNILPFTGTNKVLRLLRQVQVRGHRRAGEDATSDEDELHRALGRIAANWSLIEIASGLVLMSLVGSRDEALARAVVAGQRVENVWETIESLLSTYGSDTDDELAEFQLVEEERQPVPAAAQRGHPQRLVTDVGRRAARRRGT